MVLGRRYLDKEVGNKMSPKEFKEMLEEMFVLNGVFNIGDFIPWLAWLDLQGYVRRMKTVSKRLDAFLEEVVEEHDRRRKGVENYVANDMVDVLLQQADDPQLKLNRMRVKAYTLASTPQLFPSPCSVFMLIFFDFSKAFDLFVCRT